MSRFSDRLRERIERDADPFESPAIEYPDTAGTTISAATVTKCPMCLCLVLRTDKVAHSDWHALLEDTLSRIFATPDSEVVAPWSSYAAKPATS